MNIFKKIWRKLTHTMPCKDLNDLCKYIKKGDIYGLWYWIESNIWYKSDVKPEDSWQNSDMAIRTNSGDCEEMAGIAADVIESWHGWKAKRIVCKFANPDLNHAVCIATGPAKIYLLGYGSPKEYSIGMEVVEIIRNVAPKAICFMECNRQGYGISEKVYL